MSSKRNKPVFLMWPCSLFSLQSVSFCATRCWTATPRPCLCGSWLCRAPLASVCSGMKSSTSTRLQRTCLWTSEGRSVCSASSSLLCLGQKVSYDLYLVLPFCIFLDTTNASMTSGSAKNRHCLMRKCKYNLICIPFIVSLKFNPLCSLNNKKKIFFSIFPSSASGFCIINLCSPSF